MRCPLVRSSGDTPVHGNYPDAPKSYLSRRADVRFAKATNEKMGKNSPETDTLAIFLLRFSDSQ